MTVLRLVRAACRQVALLVIACATVGAAAAAPEAPSRLSGDLAALYQAAVSGQKATAGEGVPHFDAQGRVLVEVDLACSPALPTAALKGAGLALSASVNVPPLCAVEGWIAPQALAALAQVTGVVRVKLPATVTAQHAHKATAQL
jgi:hypothetical protein